MEIVIVAPAHVPLVIGGAERLWSGLLDHLNQETEHVADLIKLPGPERTFAEVIDSYRRFSALDLTAYEVVISGKYPSWMTEHPRHICYMLHPLRGLYDTYPPNLPATCAVRHPDVRSLLRLLRGEDRSRDALAECFARAARLSAPRLRRPWRRPVPAEVFAFPGPLIREIVHFCDEVAFAPGQIARFAAISRSVAEREGYFPAHAEVAAVHPPSALTGFRAPRTGRYFFTVSRLDRPKRIDLQIEAVKSLPSDVELLIAGTGPDEARLRELADDGRVRFLGYVNDEELLDLYAEATAVLFTPEQEDFGLVALEAMGAAKPVITTHDAGGAAEVIADGEAGLIVAPDPADLAGAMRRLHEDPALARALGETGRERSGAVNWASACAALLDGLDRGET